MSGLWTDVEIAALRTLYPELPNDSIAAALGRTTRSIKNKAQILGLRKSAAYNARYTGRFQSGHRSWNAGLTGFQAGGRSAGTQFKRGRQPSAAHNYVPIGTLRTRDDGYLERKWTDDQSLYPAARWKAVHVELWEQHHGPVPNGHVISFLNGDKADIRLDNLECISRTDWIRRHSIHRLPEELASLCRLRGSLIKKINRMENKDHV